MKASQVLPDPTAAPGRSGWPWVASVPDWPDTMADGRPWPRISVVTPSYNQGAFLEETIRSVLQQGYPNLEYIVIDGGSTDASVDVIRKYEAWIDHWVSEKDSGQSEAINKGFARATGQLYGWLNSDDIYLDGALRAMAEAYSDPDNDGHVLVGFGEKVDLDGRVIYRHPRADLSSRGIADWSTNCFLQPACFFSAEAWARCGPIREELHYAMDVALWLEMAKHYTFCKVDRDLAWAKAHEDAKTTNALTTKYSQMEICALAIEAGHFDIGYRNLLHFAEKQHARITQLRERGRRGAIKGLARALLKRLGRS